MAMSEGQLKSLAVVAKKLREQEVPLRERQDPSGLGIGAAALLVEMAVEEIGQLRRDRDNLISYLNGISRQTAEMVKAHS